MTADPVRRSLIDSEGRTYRKLRLSVTDRCQLRCTYCMPDGPEGGQWLPRDRILSYEDMIQFAGLLAPYGIRQVRITGGEPLLRRGLEQLVAGLAAVPGIDKIALTTNGILLPAVLDDLVGAGLQAITVSIDSLDRDRYRQLTGQDELDRVRRAIDELALRRDHLDVKLNAVIIGGQNDDEILALLDFGRQLGVELRFIEYMPFGNEWGLDGVVRMEQLLATVSDHFGQLNELSTPPGSTSRRWEIPGLGGYVFGIIPTVSQTLCRDCDRLRLTADGRFLNCLFDRQGVQIREHLKSGRSDQVLNEIRRHLAGKGPGFLAVNRDIPVVPSHHMHQVGG